MGPFVLTLQSVIEKVQCSFNNLEVINYIYPKSYLPGYSNFKILPYTIGFVHRVTWLAYLQDRCPDQYGRDHDEGEAAEVAFEPGHGVNDERHDYRRNDMRGHVGSDARHVEGRGRVLVRRINVVQ